MSDTTSAARAYLNPPAGAFWKWSDDGEVIVWNDGRTIAFRGELEAVLQRQMSQIERFHREFFERSAVSFQRSAMNHQR